MTRSKNKMDTKDTVRLKSQTGNKSQQRKGKNPDSNRKTLTPQETRRNKVSELTTY